MKKNHILIIISLFLFYAIGNYFWLLQNKLPVSYDEGIHLWTSMRFAKAFINPTHNILYELVQANTTHWPPLFHLTAGLVNLIFGTSYITSVMTNMLFFLLLIISLYLIGKKIYSPEVGILAAMIVSLYPIIYGHSRLFLLDFALTAIVTFSIYCLISTDRFKNLKWSIIFGISAGLGMLIKWSYVFFILPLFAYVIGDFLRNIKKKDFLYRLKNFLATIVISFLISSIWYIIRIGRSMWTFRYFMRAVNGHVYHPLEHIRYLVLSFNNNMLSFLFFLLFIVCSILFYLKISSKFKLFLTIWYVAPICIFGFIKWQYPRFYMPILPCFALISAIGLESIGKPKLRFKKFFLVFIFTMGLVQYFNISFNHNIDKKMNLSQHQLKDIDLFYKPYIKGMYSIMGASPPHRTDWKHVYIAKSFANHAREFGNYPFMMGIIYDKNDIGLNNLFANRVMNYYLIKELIKSDVTLLGEVALALNKNDEVERFNEFITDMQGMVYISKDNTWPTLNEIENFFRNELHLSPKSIDNLINDQRLVELIDSREKFVLIDRISLPYDYYANIYIYNLLEIKRGDLAIKIFNGKMKIFYKHKEITKDIAITSDFVYKGKTYKYKDAVWDYDIISPHQVKIVAEWPNLGIIQSTLISMDPRRKNTINIKTSLKSKENITLDGWYINNLISNDYKEWIRPFSRGVFRKISMFSDPNRFEPLDLEYNGPNAVGIRENASKGLPAILFRSQDAEVFMRVGVSNTNYYHNARCVYITADSKIHLESGRSKDILDMEIVAMEDKELKNIISNIERETF